jgi:hypothetical protein
LNQRRKASNWAAAAAFGQLFLPESRLFESLLCTSLKNCLSRTGKQHEAKIG